MIRIGNITNSKECRLRTGVKYKHIHYIIKSFIAGIVWYIQSSLPLRSLYKSWS